MGYAWLNLGSILCGLIGWSAPLVYLVGRTGARRRKRRTFSAVSLGACALAIWLQICYTHHLVRIEDWSALLDTSSAVVWVSGFLLVSTLLLNLVILRVEGIWEREEGGV